MRFALPCGLSGQAQSAREWLDLVTEHGKGPKTSPQSSPESQPDKTAALAASDPDVVLQDSELFSL